MDKSRPSCASGGIREDYNLPLHIGALSIILGVSAGACALPIIALRIPKLRIPPTALFLFRHFGTGVLIATAFVHLFPTAFIFLTDPCLKKSLDRAQSTPQFGRARSGKGTRNCKTIIDPTQGHLYEDILELTGSSQQVQAGPRLALPQQQSSEDDSIDEKYAEAERKKLTLQCMLLECGILFRLVFIGMSLAVAVGQDQIVLLIAIAFHQTFEGLALGSGIAAVGWKSKALQPWFMALAYGCTTPLVQVIGIGTRNLYDPDSTTGLIVVRTMNAISSGLLTYTSLVDLLSEDFLSDHSWKTLRGNRRVVAMSLVFFGAFCMSLIGDWA